MRFGKGDKVTYTGCNDSQAKWGRGDDPREVLVVGAEYIVQEIKIHSWHTLISLDGVSGRFNDTCFADNRDDRIATLEAALAASVPRDKVEELIAEWRACADRAMTHRLEGWSNRCGVYYISADELEALLNPAECDDAPEPDELCRLCRVDPCRCADITSDELVRDAIGHIAFYFENEKVTGARSINDLREAMENLKLVVSRGTIPCAECATLRAALEPFAETYDDFRSNVRELRYYSTQIVVGDYAKAKQALAASPPAQEQRSPWPLTGTDAEKLRQYMGLTQKVMDADKKRIEEFEIRAEGCDCDD